MTTTRPTTPSDSLLQRLKRVAPWFAGHHKLLALAVLGILIGSATEPAIPALMKPLLDKGFQQGDMEPVKFHIHGDGLLQACWRHWKANKDTMSPGEAFLC